MINIYFDDLLIDDDAYSGLDNEYKLFTDNFKLGSTASELVKLSIDKTKVSSIPTDVRIEDENTSYHLVVDKIKEDKRFYNYNLTSKLVLLNYKYNAKPLIDSKKANNEDCYLHDVLLDMCSKVELDVEPFTWINDIKVDWWDSTIQARTYVSFIAELQAGYATILPNGKLTIKPYRRDSTRMIDIDDCSDFILGEHKKITRVVYDNGIIKHDFGNDIGSTVYLDSSNVYITDNNEVVENIYNRIKDFEFYLIDVPKAPMDSKVKAGDVIIFTDGINEYPTIAQYKMSFFGGWAGGYSLNVATNKQEETKLTGSNERIKSIKTEIDRTNATLRTIGEEQTEHESRITLNEQDIDSIAQTVINIIDLARHIEANNQVFLENPIANGLVKLSIKGNSSITHYLYPSPTLYPSSSLYPRANYFILVVDKQSRSNPSNNKKEYRLNIQQGLYNVGSVYDELIIESNNIKVIRRIGRNLETGELYVLSSEIEENYGTINIELFEQENEGEGTYIYLKWLEGVSYTCDFVIKNEFTTKYATTVELNSKISQTNTSIMSEVNKKVDDEEFGTKVTQNYEFVQIAWNMISEFIRFINAQLQIRNTNGNLLMALDKLGQHFYKNTGDIIGSIGLVEGENTNDIAFSINGVDGTNRMVWGVKYNNTFIPVFYYEGHNTQEGGTEVGGLFYFEAPILLQGNTINLWQDENGPYIQGSDSGYRKSIVFGNVDDINFTNSSGDDLLAFNSEYLKLYEQLEMGLNVFGDYSFDFKNNSIINVANMPTTDGIVDYFSSTTTGGYLYVGLSNGVGFSLWASSSDARLKKEIEDTKVKALDIIKKIIHRQFKWKETGKKVDIGYIAQELEEIDPNLINKAEMKDEKGNTEYEYQINNLQLLSLTTKAIQEQQVIIERQQKQINMLMDAVGLKFEEQKEKVTKHKVKDYGNIKKINLKTNKEIKNKGVRKWKESIL